MTLTGIGYGDITPQNTYERVVVVFCMLVGGCCWTFVLGSAASVFTTVSAELNKFSKDMDQLNVMFRECHIPQELRLRIRGFFYAARESRRQGMYQKLIDQMSPAMQGEVAMAVHMTWVDHVWCAARG